MDGQFLLNVGFFTVAAVLIVAAVKSMRKKAVVKEPDEVLHSPVLYDALDLIKRVPWVHYIVGQYIVRLRRTEFMVYQGSRAYGVAHAGRGEIWLDYEYVQNAAAKDVVSLILHETAHLHLRHSTYSPENERAATQWQLAAMKEFYG